MHLAYIDDSGDNDSFALGCILVPADRWLLVHDQLVEFRRRLARQLSYRMARELKATEFLSRGGPWYTLGVSVRTRIGIYGAALRELEELHKHLDVFGVVVPNRDDPDLRAPAVDDAWEVMLERLERFCSKNDTHCMLMPDEGNPVKLRALARRKRRFGYAPSAFGGSSRRVPFDRLVDDPSHRDSKHSYLTQWADLVAYSAFRRVMPRPDFPPDMWGRLGRSILLPVNGLQRMRGSTEPAGLIVWPKAEPLICPTGLLTRR